MLSDDDYKDILEQFPKFEFAFAYGSGAVEQKGYSYSDKDLPMVDFIIAVENAEEWHHKNMNRNPSHYTTPIPLNAKTIAYIQVIGYQTFHLGFVSLFSFLIINLFTYIYKGELRCFGLVQHNGILIINLLHK